VRPKVDQRAGQLSLPHLGITETETIELKRKTDEQISLVNSLEPWDQSDRQKQTKQIALPLHRLQKHTRVVSITGIKYGPPGGESAREE